MILYKIANWDRYYENHRTRELKRMDWIPVPTKMDGDGYTELILHPDGAAHFGAWLALLLIASRCDPRGTLIRSGGKPHDPASMSRISRIDPAIFRDSIARLVEIGWVILETIDSMVDTESRANPAQIPRFPAQTPRKTALQGTERKGTEGNGMVHSGSAVIGEYQTFVSLWKAPTLTGKTFPCSDVDLGCQIWINLVDAGTITAENLVEVFDGLERHKASKKWREGFVLSVPAFLGYAKNGMPAAPRWNDQPTPAEVEGEY